MSLVKGTFFLLLIGFVVCDDIPPRPLHDGEHRIAQMEERCKHGNKNNAWEGCLFEGDIMTKKMAIHPSNGVRDRTLLWPKGVVPYYINPHINNTRQLEIRAVMAEYHDISCIRFRKYQRGDRDWIEIRNGAGCWSYVGRLGGGQVVNIGDWCTRKSDIVHELLHALGFQHMQCNPNRDQYVTIHKQNIMKGNEGNFAKYKPNTLTDFNIAYDYNSVMHYSSKAFSKNGRDTITANKKGIVLGNQRGFSKSDITKLKTMYGCK